MGQTQKLFWASHMPVTVLCLCPACGMKLSQPAACWQASTQNSAAPPKGSSFSYARAEFLFYIIGTARDVSAVPLTFIGQPYL